MTATISAGDGSGTTQPMTVLSPYETTWQGRTVVHDLIGGGIAVSLVAPRPRSGTLALLYPDESSAFAAAALHSAETTFTLTEDTRPSVSLTYVVVGDGITVALDEDTLTLFTVTVEYQEVIP